MAVKSRLVLMFPGFEPVPVEAHCRRFIREAAKTAPVYGMTFVPSAVTVDLTEGAGIRAGRFSASTSGEGWSTDTEVVLYGLGEINEGYAARNPLLRAAAGYLALADFIVTGTFFRYLSTGVRYGLFFIFPLLILLGAVIAGWVAYMFGAWMFADSPQAAGWALAVLAFLLIFTIVGTSGKLHFLLIMDDWAFARDIARGRRPDIEARFARLSADAVRRLMASDADETVFAAHSFGAIAAVLALSSALREADRATGHPGLLTVGSSLLKIGLHPRARQLGDAVKSIVAADVPWLDVQSLTDILNFYGTRPAALIAGQSGPNQNTTKVRFRNQLEPATYRSIKRDFFRVHRQFVYGVERRSHYAYHAILCGPEPFAEIARRGGLAEDWTDSGARGSLSP